MPWINKVWATKTSIVFEGEYETGGAMIETINERGEYILDGVARPWRSIGPPATVQAKQVAMVDSWWRGLTAADKARLCSDPIIRRAVECECYATAAFERGAVLVGEMWVRVADRLRAKAGVA